MSNTAEWIEEILTLTQVVEGRSSTAHQTR